MEHGHAGRLHWPLVMEDYDLEAEASCSVSWQLQQAVPTQFVGCGQLTKLYCRSMPCSARQCLQQNGLQSRVYTALKRVSESPTACPPVQCALQCSAVCLVVWVITTPRVSHLIFGSILLQCQPGKQYIVQH